MKREAWTAAALYIVVLAAGIFAEVGVRQALVAPGDAAETSRRLLGAEAFYRAGVAADVVMTACDVVLAVLLYRLLREYGRSLSLVAAAFRLMTDAMLGMKTVLALAPLMMLKNVALLTGLGRAGAEALSLLSLRLHDSLYGIVMLFAGLNLGVMGVLLLRRGGRLSRAAGGLLVVGGVCDILIHGASILSPTMARALPDALALAPPLAEVALVVWLLMSVRGAHTLTGNKVV